MEKKTNLEKLFESQEFAPEDELTAVIRQAEQFSEDELSFDELDLVAAASSEPNYNLFKDFLNKKNKK